MPNYDHPTARARRGSRIAGLACGFADGQTRRPPRLARVAAVLAATVAAVSATGPRYVLRAQTEVSGGQITLAELLVTPLPAAEQERAQATELTAAPAPGRTRSWPRAEVAVALRQSGWTSSDFSIPEEVMVSRTAAAVGLEAVRPAVLAWLRQQPGGAGLEAAPADFQFSSPAAPVGAAVTAISARYDALQERWDVICRAGTSPVPFHVLVHGARGAAVPEAAPPKAGTKDLRPVLVHTQHAAQLQFASAGYAISGAVMPERDGRQGDKIPVLNQATHAVLEVYVIGTNEVSLAAPLPGDTQALPHENR